MPAAAGRAQAVTDLPDKAGNTPAAEVSGTSVTGQGRVVVTADRLRYDEPHGVIWAEGNVRLWYQNLTMTADTAEADLETRQVKAEGRVSMEEAGRKIKCAQLRYDLNTGSAEAQGILFATFPWYYQGKSVRKQGKKQVYIVEPSFTTCNCLQPHYHLTATRIDIVLGESLTAYHTVLYVGATPLFYWPWLWRSLKDNRPPFSIRAGYNSYEGAYVKTKFNYFLLEGNYGALSLDLMERKGLGFGLDQNFKYRWFGSGEGTLSGFYVRESDTHLERGSVSLQSRQEITDRDLLQLSADYLSSRDFNRDYYSTLVDSFQQKSSLSYSRRADAYYLGAVMQDVETLYYEDSLDANSGKYFASQRQLPNVSFSLNSFQMAKWPAPLYFGLSASFDRGFSRSAPSESDFFRDSLSFTPVFTQTYAAPRIPTQPSLSGSLSFPTQAYLLEQVLAGESADSQTPARLDWDYTTSVSLTDTWVNYRRTKPTHNLQSRLTHTFTRKLAHLDEPGTQLAGVKYNYLSLAMDYSAGSLFSLQSQTAYNFLNQDDYPNWWQKLEPVTFSGRAAPLSSLSCNWQGNYAWDQHRLTTGYFSVNMNQKNWSAGLSQSYSYTGLESNPHALFTTLNGNYQFKFGLSLQSSLQYNFTEHHINNFSMNLSRDLHCWEVQAGLTHYWDASGGRDELGIGINLKAFPQLRVGMPGSTGLTVGE